MAAKKQSVTSMVQASRAQANVALSCILVANEFGAEPSSVLEAHGKGDLTKYQKLAIYLAHVEMRSSQRCVADAFDCSRGKVQVAVAAVEDWRDGGPMAAKIDALIDRICPAVGGAPLRFKS